MKIAPRSTALRLAVLCLIALNWTLAMLAWRGKSPTFDESLHIVGGYAYWKFNDFRLHPENGNLPQRWVTLPLIWSSEIRFPSLDQEAWRDSDILIMADQFLHGVGNSLESILFRSRAFAALLGTAVCIVVFFWSRQIFGLAGAFLSLFLCALCPTMLAHGGVATSDMCAALFFTLAVWCQWRVLEWTTPGRVVASIMATSLLLLSKMSGVLILPMTLLMVLAHSLTGKRLIVRWRGSLWEAGSRGVAWRSSRRWFWSTR